MASLPDDQCTEDIGFFYTDTEVDGTPLRGSITPSDQTMALRREVQDAIADGRSQERIDSIRQLETQSVQDDIDEAMRSIRDSLATTNAANTAAPPTRHNPSENPSAAADDHTDFNPEEPPAPTEQGK